MHSIFMKEPEDAAELALSPPCPSEALGLATSRQVEPNPLVNFVGVTVRPYVRKRYTKVR
jgi:hypothetical protein